MPTLVSLHITLALVLGPAPGPPSPRASVASLPSVAEAEVTDPHAEARALGLVPLPNGGYAYRGVPGERFDATIHRDGTVEFVVDAGVQIKIEGLCLLAVCVRKGARKQRRRPTLREVARVAGAIGAIVAASLADGGSEDRSYHEPAAGPIPGSQPSGPLALSAGALQGSYGYLPAPVAAMGGFLERTFELRLELAERDALARIDRELQALPARLTAIWDDARPLVDRHADTLALWLDVDVTLEHLDPFVQRKLRSRLDRRRSQAAAQAQTRIRAFVRRRAPAGSKAAFARSELQRFNRRPEVTVPFWPYRDDS